MPKYPLLAIAALTALVPNGARADQFADSVVNYTPGTGFATEFGTGLPYTNPSAALGEPTRVIPGEFGGPVDPFNPPYLRDQVVSVGAGGSLTVGFSAPIADDPLHPYGLDFLIFGNAGFIVTNGDFSGGGITDGSLFAANDGATRVSVSADNVRFYTLNPSLAPVVDGLYPTVGSGLFSKPVNPALKETDFSGKGLAGIASLYAGSGGGTGYDIAWAQDENGKPVALPEVRFVRVEVLRGASEIDAISAVPEPSAWLLGFLSLAGAAGWRRTAGRKGGI